MTPSFPQFVSSPSGTSVRLTFCLAGFFKVDGARREFRQIPMHIMFGELLSYTSSCFLTENVGPIFLVV